MISALLLTAQATVPCAVAQSLSVPHEKFEVASIKSCNNAEPPSGGDPSPERLHLACVTAANLIRLAYLVFPTAEPNAPVSPAVFQMPISGGPSWIDSDRYTIDAKAERRVNVEMMKGPMMRSLLEERFRLELHRESRQASIFELTLARSGPHLQRAKKGGCVAYDRNIPPPAAAPGRSLLSSAGFCAAIPTAASISRGRRWVTSAGNYRRT